MIHRRFHAQTILSPYSDRLTSTNYWNYIKQRYYYTSDAMTSPLKRKADSLASTKVKKQKVVVPEYHLTPSRHDEHGEIVWPAPTSQIERAREIIREW